MAKIAEAVLSGEAPRNQIFLSASQRQALKFRREITGWVRRVTGVELKGAIILLDFFGLHDVPEDEDGDGDGKGAERKTGIDPVGLYFLSTNSATAQGESGDFYFDEYAWVHGFAELAKVASAMATHTIYKKTFFSTPSTRTHESFAMWSGAEWNKGRPRAEQREFDCSRKNLRRGAIMPDGAWHHLLTIDDACEMGLSKMVDPAELRREYSPEEFANLYDCEDIDDSESSFPNAALGRCRVYSFYTWSDFKPAETRPFGNKAVSIGYDPDKGGRDGAALAVVALPEKGGGKFRLLEKKSLKGLGYEEQAAEIRKMSRRYNVVDIGIDTGGAGDAVFRIVRGWHQMARKIDYTVWVKAQMVHKMQAVIRAGRFEYDSGWADVSAAFMAIRPALVGKTVTYIALRGEAHGHADIAWATMHAVASEPIEADGNQHQQSSVEFFQ
jgi:hypothetical protein